MISVPGNSYLRSSLSKSHCWSRFHDFKTQVVELVGTVRENHHQISTWAGTPIDTTDDVMDMPLAIFGNKFTAGGAFPILLLPP